MSLTAAERARLRYRLIADEGLKHKVYKCPAGFWTIGVGRNVETKGITEAEAMYLLDNDISACQQDLYLRYQSWFPQLDSVRQAALINMCFNLGITRFSKFEKAIDCLRKQDYEGAAIEMLASAWAEQVGNRALRLAEQIRTGAWVE